MDIYHDWEPVALVGAGWYSKEISRRGERFRWVADGAWIHVSQLPGLVYDVTLDVEPGPAVGLQNFILAVYENGKSLLASLPIPGRAKVTFRLPAGDPAVHHLELRTENTSAPVEAPGDPRTLKYRIFSIEIKPIPDVSQLERQIDEANAKIVELQAREADLQAKIETDERAAAEAGDRAEREIAARDAVIERLEATAARLRAELDEARRAADEKHAELEAVNALADERLAVIRALHDQALGSVAEVPDTMTRPRMP